MEVADANALKSVLLFSTKISTSFFGFKEKQIRLFFVLLAWMCVQLEEIIIV